MEEVELPEPLPTEIRVRVHAAGVNPVDAKTRAGRGMAGALGDPPFTLGWDVAGVVDQVGGGVTRFAPGDRVFGMPWFPRQAGGYGEVVTAPSRHFARTPEGLDHVSAAGLPLAGLTAWQLLVDTAGVEAGDRVLVHAGAGGVGHLAVQIARARGAHVVTTARAERHDWLRQLGAQQVIDHTSQELERETGDLDLVVDLVGSEDTGLRSLEVLRRDGLYVGVPSGMPDRVMQEAAARGRRATGFLVEPDHAGLEQLAALVDEGRLRAAVERTFPLEGAAAAHEHLEQGHTRGKLVLEVG